jgi:hypothetical protein
MRVVALGGLIRGHVKVPLESPKVMETFQGTNMRRYSLVELQEIAVLIHDKQVSSDFKDYIGYRLMVTAEDAKTSGMQEREDLANLLFDALHGKRQFTISTSVEN